MVKEYQTQYQKLQIKPSKAVTLLENRIAMAFKLLSLAKTEAAKKRYEAQIVSTAKLLDTELARLKKVGTTSAVPVKTVSGAVRTPATPVTSKAASLPSEIPAFTSPSPTWDGATLAKLTYYADGFEGENTSNGNTFRQAGFSAARCNIPLNTLLQLRYGDTGIIVKANDRPNCSRYPDIVDLSKAAYSRLSAGSSPGSFVPLGLVTNESVKEYLQTDFFADVGIGLDANIPDWYLPNETLRISGHTTDGNTESLIYVVTPSGQKISYGQDNLDKNRFEYLIPLTEVGSYEFVVASGRSFSGVHAMTFEVLDATALQNKQFFAPAPTGLVTGFTTTRREA